jgi:negative regulator of flagellin synthesis FlgM
VSNKINDLTTSVTPGRTAAVTPARDVVAGGSNAAQPAESGQVQISDTATQLASLEQALRDSPAVDAARVAQLRSAIEQGTYTVNSDQVATGLIQMERTLARLGNPGK